MCCLENDAAADGNFTLFIYGIFILKLCFTPPRLEAGNNVVVVVVVEDCARIVLRSIQQTRDRCQFRRCFATTDSLLWINQLFFPFSNGVVLSFPPETFPVD